MVKFLPVQVSLPISLSGLWALLPWKGRPYSFAFTSPTASSIMLGTPTTLWPIVESGHYFLLVHGAGTQPYPADWMKCPQVNKKIITILLPLVEHHLNHSVPTVSLSSLGLHSTFLRPSSEALAPHCLRCCLLRHQVGAFELPWRSALKLIENKCVFLMMMSTVMRHGPCAGRNGIVKTTWSGWTLNCANYL